MKKLIRFAPTKGRRLTDGKAEMIQAEEIRQGDILRILPGETIPVDGTIISGETSDDQSIMTGESLPVDKGEGEEVFCGTINRFGSIDISATKVGENSSLQKLIRMVQDAENKQAPMQRIADRAAIGQATKHGVIIKSGEALEKTGKVDMISFDETISETDLLSLTASAEAKSEHPLGKAIVAYAKAKEVPLAESTASRSERHGFPSFSYAHPHCFTYRRPSKNS